MTGGNGEPDSSEAFRILDRLALVGQDITASFDVADIFAAIERHVGALLDTATLYIGLLDETGEWLEVPFFVDDGRRGESRRIRVDDPQRPAALAVRERSELYREKSLAEAIATDIPGTVPTLSALFAPLIVRDRLVGVMSVQSAKVQAYGPRERLIFRSLCAYAAVALANAEGYRRLAALEALQTLGRVGQEITARLDREGVLLAVERASGALFGTATIELGLVDAAGITLDLVRLGGRKDERPRRRVALDDPEDPAARALREPADVLLPGASAEIVAGIVRALAVGDRRRGAMGLHAAPGDSLDPQRILVFRSLCAYVAVALANAEAYRAAQDARSEATRALEDLRTTQASLIEAEKMASLGEIVAGVAHEVNTPVGTALMVASSFGRDARATGAALAAGTLKRSDLQRFLETAEEAARQLETNLWRAGDLVGRFKEVAADRTSDERRVFDLAETVRSILASLGGELKRSPHAVETVIPPGLSCDSYPGALGQILSNLILNATLHAFPDGRTGTIRLTASSSGADRATLAVADDGVGIDEASRSRIFDPFFTTRRGQGGTGLGLHIAYNLATQSLKGRLACESRPGEGATFRLDFPRIVPD